MTKSSQHQLFFDYKFKSATYSPVVRAYFTISHLSYSTDIINLSSLAVVAIRFNASIIIEKKTIIVKVIISESEKLDCLACPFLRPSLTILSTLYSILIRYNIVYVPTCECD